MASSDELSDHHRNPRNQGSFYGNKNFYLIGQAEGRSCDDFLSMSFEVFRSDCPICQATGKVPNATCDGYDIEFVNCEHCYDGAHWVIGEIRHVSDGCGFIVAIASWLSEHLKDRPVKEVLVTVTRGYIIDKLGLPRSARHCATIARAAIRDAFELGFGKAPHK